MQLLFDFLNSAASKTPIFKNILIFSSFQNDTHKYLKNTPFSKIYQQNQISQSDHQTYTDSFSTLSLNLQWDISHINVYVPLKLFMTHTLVFNGTLRFNRWLNLIMKSGLSCLKYFLDIIWVNFDFQTFWRVKDIFLYSLLLIIDILLYYFNFKSRILLIKIFVEWKNGKILFNLLYILNWVFCFQGSTGLYKLFPISCKSIKVTNKFWIHFVDNNHLL